MDVTVFPCKEYDLSLCREALEAVLSALGGLDWVRPGMKIGIKANLVSFLKPEAAATTHPTLLCALTSLLKEGGAEVIIGDSPGGLYSAAFLAPVYHATGMREAEKHGAKLNQDFSQKTAEFPQAMVAKSFQYTAWLDGCDEIINFCKLKTHGMMAMSSAAKNLFGTIPGTLKAEYHFKYSDPADFARMLVDLNEYWKPKLNIVDAVVGMEGNGPTAGTPRPIGAVLAGTNPHKVDLACAAILGIPRSEVPTLEAALERKLIPEKAEDLNICGNLSQFFIPDYQKIETKNGLLFQNDIKGPFGKLVSPFLKHTIASRPKVSANECIGCKKCAEICPAKAITMTKGKPHIHRSPCIRCFCCQEFCPVGAMKVARPPLARLLNRS